MFVTGLRAAGTPLRSRPALSSYRYPPILVRAYTQSSPYNRLADMRGTSFGFVKD